MATPISTSQTISAPADSGRRANAQPVSTSSVVEVERQAVATGGNTAPVQAAAQQQSQSAQELAQATRDLSDYIQTVSRSLQISVDQDLGSTVITVMDSDTDEIVRQIPSEEVLQIARFLQEQQASAESSAAAVRGLLVDQEG